MTRKEEREQEAGKAFPLPPLYNEEQRRSKQYAESWARARDQQWGFQMGAMWADEHPREGLWDKEKVIAWVKDTWNDDADEKFVKYRDLLVESLIKKMEG